MPVALWPQDSFKLQKLQSTSKQEVEDVRRTAKAEIKPPYDAFALFQGIEIPGHLSADFPSHFLVRMVSLGLSRYYKGWEVHTCKGGRLAGERAYLL